MSSTSVRYLALFLLAASLLPLERDIGEVETSVSAPHDDPDPPTRTQSIRPYAGNPFYWQYKGEPVLLIGGSKEDNLFQIDDLEGHLDLLQAAGGNYVRNTMSSRDPGNERPFRKLANGRFDLNQWNEDYWIRFENLLDLAYERDIIVQVEIWDPWDYFKAVAYRSPSNNDAGWESDPFNPANNINYTSKESGLPEVIDYYSQWGPTDHPFFQTVPKERDLELVRRYQEASVDRLLSIALDYPNVLYCMNNEIGERQTWGNYWAEYIRTRADEAEKKVYLADMRRRPNFNANGQVNLMLDYERFDFVEVSQNNWNVGQEHYEQILRVRARLRDHPKPLNNVKIYGGDRTDWTTSVQEGEHQFWRNIFGGAASVRFHRPPTGLGLSERAQANIRSMRMFADDVDVFTMQPAHELLSERARNEAYLLAEPGTQYALFFTDGGTVEVDLSDADGKFVMRWLDIRESRWEDLDAIQGGGALSIQPPAEGSYVAVLTRE